MRTEDLRASMNINVELILTEPEIENQANKIQGHQEAHGKSNHGRIAE